MVIFGKSKKKLLQSPSITFNEQFVQIRKHKPNDRPLWEMTPLLSENKAATAWYQLEGSGVWKTAQVQPYDHYLQAKGL